MNPRWQQFMFMLAGWSLVLWTGANLALAGNQATGQATAFVQEPLLLTLTAELEFGQIRPGENAGTVVVTTSNTRFATGGTDIIGPKFERAEFSVSGSPGAFYTMVLDASTALHDNSASPDPGVTSLEVTDLKAFSVTVGSEGTTGKMGLDGTDMVYVGGTLQVPTSAKNGKYEGDVTLTIHY